MTLIIPDNVALLTDSYKPSHWKQYPKSMRNLYAFFESRGGEFSHQVFFGLQYILMRHLTGNVVTTEVIDEAEEVLAAHYGRTDVFNRASFEYIRDVHGGRLPIRIKAVPEGTVVPTKNVLFTIECTDQKAAPAVAWIVEYLETLLSQVWYPTTVATQSKFMRGLILKNLEETGDLSLIDFKLHDFGFRGSTSVESAGIGGMAHLVNFKGTDTLQAIRFARAYYHEPMAGFSIPAAEHSTITSWGRSNEAKAFANLLEQYPDGLVAVPCDSYDHFNAVKEILGRELKSIIMARNGTVIARPDSGTPSEMVVKTNEMLGQRFGYSVNQKGYRVLDSHVRGIQGDKINRQTLPEILDATKAAGWSGDNFAYGSGGGLLQNVDRDTCKFAMKCAAIDVEGQWQDVYKDPVTDPGKRSKAGRMKLVREGNTFATVNISDSRPDELLTVFENGELIVDQSFANIRARALNGEVY